MSALCRSIPPDRTSSWRGKGDTLLSDVREDLLSHPEPTQTHQTRMRQGEEFPVYFLSVQGVSEGALAKPHVPQALGVYERENIDGPRTAPCGTLST